MSGAASEREAHRPNPGLLTLLRGGGYFRAAPTCQPRSPSGFPPRESFGAPTAFTCGASASNRTHSSPSIVNGVSRALCVCRPRYLTVCYIHTAFPSLKVGY